MYPYVIILVNFQKGLITTQDIVKFPAYTTREICSSAQRDGAAKVKVNRRGVHLVTGVEWRRKKEN